MSDTVSHIASASHWASEDGGPCRTQLVPGRLGGPLRTTAVRDALGTTMVLLRDPDEVHVLRHTLGRRPLEDPCVAWVERIDPETLEPLGRSPVLAAGPFWPGGMAWHANGSLHVVMGRHCHRLSPGLELLATAELPAPRPYNSLVTLGDGTLAMKDIDRGLTSDSRLVLLDAETLGPVCEPVDLGEPAIARLSADGDDLYVVGARSVSRWRWDGAALRRDPDWGGPYVIQGGSYGWDPVISGDQLWFQDNGAHDFVTTMRGAGVAPGPVHLIRMSLDDPGDFERVRVCGAPHGAVTDPPLYDAERRIAVAYDSANGVVQAFSFTDRLEPLWRRELSHAAHMILFAETGELVVHDFHGPAFNRTRLGRAIGRRGAWLLRRPRARRLFSGFSRDEVVVLDISTGAELGRTTVPTPMQSVVFPAPGFDRDVYWATMTTIARVQAG